ncbi:hypothetical protein [Nocardia sp. NPDC050413]|uniref:hypothetical protein n=1 Tax=Nocardia sp. NPDC050413 TaxID=3155784 RepID=UPI0033F42816
MSEHSTPNKRILVVGGGYAGALAAEPAERGRRVTLICGTAPLRTDETLTSLDHDRIVAAGDAAGGTRPVAPAQEVPSS